MWVAIVSWPVVHKNPGSTATTVHHDAIVQSGITGVRGFCISNLRKIPGRNSGGVDWELSHGSLELGLESETGHWSKIHKLPRTWLANYWRVHHHPLNRSHQMRCSDEHLFPLMTSSVRLFMEIISSRKFLGPQHDYQLKGGSQGWRTVNTEHCKSHPSH